MLINKYSTINLVGIPVPVYVVSATILVQQNHKNIFSIEVKVISPIIHFLITGN